MIIDDLKFAINNRQVWWYTATSRTRARFARTTLGSFWLGFSNLLSISTLGFVYGTVFKVKDFSSYFVYLGVGLVIWNTISSAICTAPNLFSNNSSNIKNMNLRPLFYTLEEWAFQIQTFFQSFLLVFIVLLFFKPTLFINTFTASWIPIINFILFIYWFPLLLCLISIRYTDFAQLVPIVMQIVFLTSPILYRKESLGNISWIAELNIFYRILDPLRESINNGFVDYRESLLILIVNFIGIYFSLRFFKRSIRKLPFLV
tara:strand:+ start:140 stop:919 length:780 start_codon:yes stop_codon:yes gene_type:complete